MNPQCACDFAEAETPEEENGFWKQKKKQVWLMSLAC